MSSWYLIISSFLFQFLTLFKLEIIIPTPSEIVKELNRYIIGQQNAKKVVAIAFRNLKNN